MNKKRFTASALLYKLSISFIILAVLLFSFPGIYTFLVEKNFFLPLQNSSPIVISSTVTSNKTKGEIPQRISIPSVGIDLPIVPAKVVNGYWELSDTTASYGLGSGFPGKKGNTVIFAHARKGLFLPLQNITLSDKVIVATKNHIFTYKVTNIKQVYPSDTAVISKTKDATLTLFTCTGFMDEKRLIVVAKPME